MPRCQMHLDLDRNTKKAEDAVQIQKLPSNHPVVLQSERRIQSIIGLMQHRGHGAANYYCPDETAEELAERLKAEEDRNG